MSGDLERYRIRAGKAKKSSLFEGIRKTKLERMKKDRGDEVPRGQFSKDVILKN